MVSLLGIGVFLGLALVFSEARERVAPGFVAKAVGAQFGLGALLLKVGVLVQVFGWFSQAVQILQQVTQEASIYLFGYLSGGEPPFEIVRPDQNFVVVFQVLPLIIVVSALSALLFHWGVIPAIVRALAWGLSRFLGVTGALALGSAGTVFFGTIEAPLLIRPYLGGLSRSEMFALISCSMTTVSGAVLVLYSSVLKGVVDNPIQHLLVASVISVPAALAVAHLMIPPDVSDGAPADLSGSPYRDSVDAVLKGGEEGMKVVLSVVTVLLTTFSLVYLANRGLGLVWPDLTLQDLVGMPLRPLMFLIGIPWVETLEAARLMSTKIILNEFVAYLELSKMTFAPSTRVLLTYSLCGFANLGSFGIIVGGLGAILPERQKEIVSLTARSLVSGNLACLMTASVVALVNAFLGA